MENPRMKKRLISRKAAYGILIVFAVTLTICLWWFAWRAMAKANPWFTGIGIAGAAVYVIVVLSRNNPLRSFKPSPPGDTTRPKLRIVKK